MEKVLRLWRRLEQQPECVAVENVSFRNYVDERDIAAWLQLHNSVFGAASNSSPTAKGRPWSEQDFRREFDKERGWRAAQMWLAYESGGSDELIGSASVAVRSGKDARCASIQWLSVAPDWRRRGVATALVSRLENSCWKLGLTHVLAETLSSWDNAVAFYRARDYRE